MKIQDVPFGVANWEAMAGVEHPGESGASLWRTVEVGNIRVRRVDYSAGFKADHYCQRGHVGMVLEGELGIRLKNGREFRLRPGMSFQTADDASNPHLVFTEKGAKVFIVD